MGSPVCRPPKLEDLARPGRLDALDDAAPEVVAVVNSFTVVLAAAFVVFASELVRLCGLLAPAVSDKAGKELAAIVRGIDMKADRRKDMGASGVRLTSRIKVIQAFGVFRAITKCPLPDIC